MQIKKKKIWMFILVSATSDIDELLELLYFHTPGLKVKLMLNYLDGTFNGQLCLFELERTAQELLRKKL